MNIRMSTGRYISILWGTLALAGLAMTSWYSYLLFHCLVELFSILVACSIFLVVWNTRRVLDNQYLLFLGVAYIFVAGLDLVHMLAFQGMNVIPSVFGESPANQATQLWIGARYLESASLLLALLFIRRKVRVNLVMLAYLACTALILASIFYWHIFPDCFVQGMGLTTFKKDSEYIICAILLGVVLQLVHYRGRFDSQIWRLLLASVIVMIASELAFTRYSSPFGSLNLVGHILKVIAFFLIYKALVETGLGKPYDLLFRELKQSEEQLRQARDGLEIRVQERTTDLRKTVQTLQAEVEARLRAQRDQARLATIVACSDDAILSETLDGIITSWNAGAQRVYGYSAEEAVGQHVSMLAPPDRKNQTQQMLVRVARGERIEHFETMRIRKDGQPIYISLSISPLRNEVGQVTGLSTIARDLTDRWRLEAEVLKAGEMERQRIGHDLHDTLGQNLTGIAFLTKLLEQKLLQQSLAEAANATEIIKLVNESAGLTRSLARGLSLLSVGAASLMTGLQELAGQTSERFGIECRLDCADMGLVEDRVVATQLYRIAQEAVSNAVKHGKARSIVIGLSSHMPVRLTIRDDGVGLPNGAGDGKGMGLRIMNYRANVIGGTLEIKPDPAGGTVVTCKL